MIGYLRRAFGSIGSILEVLWPSHDYWYWPTDVEPSDQGGPGILDKQIPTVSPDEIRAAADAIEALSYLHDYDDKTAAHVAWSPAYLREAAEEMEL